MRVSVPVGILLVLFLTACSGLSLMSSKKQESELFNNGFTAMSGGDYTTAEYLFSQALLVNDKNPYTLLNLGVINQENHNYEKARKFYQSVIDLDPVQTASPGNVLGYDGQNLGDIARLRMKKLPIKIGSRIETMASRPDTDGDGVSDDQDQCKDTPQGASVDIDGCWAVFGIFPSGKTDIAPDTYKQLDQAVQVLLQNPTLRLEIQGHTDDSGSAAFNQRLSEKRARSVMLYFIEKGISPERLRWTGYGQSRPMASNQTAEGREKNRRIEFAPLP